MRLDKIQRYHDLDALRSTMLLLGIVVHAGQCYFPQGPFRDPDLWYFYDSTGSSLLPSICAAIHVYRMPVFFVLAGFFAALLIAKRGLSGLIENRIYRIALPLAASMLMVVPSIYYASEYAWSRRGGTPEGFGVGDGFKGMFCDNLYHLWFLWHLLIFYGATAIAVRTSQWVLWKRGLNKSNRSQGSWLGTLIQSNWGVVVCASVSILFLTQMKRLPGGLDTSFQWIPPWYLLGIYGLCYWYGWQLFHFRARLDSLKSNTLARVSIGVLAVVSYLVVLGIYLQPATPRWLISTLSVLSAISIWSMVEAWLAFFRSYFQHPSRIARYVSDSSYWVYLTHVPVLLVCQGWLASTDLPAELKFLTCVVSTTGLCLFSYHFLVRATVIGKFLNGRRYPAWPFQLSGAQMDPPNTRNQLSK